MNRLAPFAMAVAVLALAMSPAARAVEPTEHACSGTITTLPATITTSGVWCVGTPLNTAIASGAAVTIDANNVTLACNDRSLNGSAGTGSNADGIVVAGGRSNVTIRGCAVGGFRRGIVSTDATAFGLLIEKNIVNAVRYTGIDVAGAGTIRDNQVWRIGEATAGLTPTAIVARGTFDVTGNGIGIVMKTTAAGAQTLRGLYVVDNDGGVVRDNTVQALYGLGSPGIAIDLDDAQGVVVRGNRISDAPTGIRCTGSVATAIDNTNILVTSPLTACTDGGGNLSAP